jgi:RNA polymerase sigma-70 factor, ECF subfamily
MIAEATSGDAAAGFDRLRPKLMRVAYRMLGSVSDAEDILQEAFIRWMKADRAEVRAPEAFLRRTVTRLCLNSSRRDARARPISVPGFPIRLWKRTRSKTSLCH